MTEQGLITLKINDKFVNNEKLAYLYPSFISILTYSIARFTTIEYWVKRRGNTFVEFVVKTYSNIDKSQPYIDVIKNKAKELFKHVMTLDASMFSNNELWLFRTIKLKLEKQQLSFTDILQAVVSCGDDVIADTVLKFSINGLQMVDYKVVQLCDGSTIRQLIDPYITNYGIYCDYSKTFDEYGYIYNGLHVFEHYIVGAWDDSNNKDVIEINGCTYSNGLMYIYTVLSNIDALKERFIKYVRYHIKSSDEDFIKQSDVLKRETLRTISEGYKIRNLTRMARTEQNGFNINYPTNVLAWWASKPMNILLITNKELHIDTDKLNDYYKRYHKDVQQPTKQSFDYFPREIYHVLTNEHKHLFKKPTDKIIQKVFNSRFKSLYGIDTRTIEYGPDGQKNDISWNHTITQLFLIFAKFKSNDFMADFTKHTPIPNNVRDFENVSITAAIT